MTINPTQLSFLLEIPAKDARAKIICAIERHKGNKAVNLKKVDDSYDKYCSCEEPILSKYLRIDLNRAITEITNNFCKRPATKGWILSYPETKLKPDKKGFLPKTVSIPDALRSFLTDEDIAWIVSEWNKRYEFYITKHSVIFK